MSRQWKDVPLGSRSGDSLFSTSSCGDYTSDVPKACFQSVYAFVTSGFTNHGEKFPDTLLDEPAVSKLVETMTSCLGWSVLEQKENALSPEELVDHAFDRFGQLQPGKKLAFVVYYGGLGGKAITRKLK